MRFFKMQNQPNNEQFFFKEPSNSSENGSLSTNNTMIIENDFMKLPNLTYPDDNQNHQEFSNMQKMEVHPKIKTKTHDNALRSRISPCNAWALFSKAIKQNDLSKIIHLIRIRKQDPNIFDSHRRTPLHMATAAGHYDICEYLLKNGADPNQKDVIGNTPLHLASCSSKVDIVNLLLKNGANFNILDSTNFSPLTLACSKLKIALSLVINVQSGHQDLARKCTDIVRLLDMYIGNKNLPSLELQQFKGKILEKIVNIDKTSDLENDEKDLLTSISALSINTSNT